jgi:SAM-dependent methyltransferase
MGMGTDLQGACDFYGTALGGVAARTVSARLAILWPDLTGQSVIGLGYAGPYLGSWREQARWCIAAIPGDGTGPLPALAGCCLVEEDALPFADLSLDRILLVHGLENAENARRLLREVWRVLRDDGRVLIVAPNRVGLWAHIENTPFGQGQPYSPGQIERLLAASLFRVERRDRALYMPPTAMRMVIRSAPAIERISRRVLPRFAGVTITEAVKDVYAGIPLRKVKRRRLALVESL